MKKLSTKWSNKQLTIAGAVAVVLLGGGITAGVVNHNNTVHAQHVAQVKAHEAKLEAVKKAAAEKLAHDKEAAQQKQVATLLATATTNPSDASIKVVNDAIAKLTDQKEKTKDTDLVKTLNARLALIKTAQTAVSDYQKHANDATKQKAAAQAISALKDKNDGDVKAQLQKLFDASNKQAQEAAKAAQEQAKTTPAPSSQTPSEGTPAQANSDSSVDSTNAPAANSSSSETTPQAPTATGNGGSSNYTAPSPSAPVQSPSTPAPSQPAAPSTPTQAPSTPAPSQPVTQPQAPVAHTYQGWVRDSTTGAIIFSQNYSSWNAASSAATSYMDSDVAVNLSFENHQLNYGVTQLS